MLERIHIRSIRMNKNESNVDFALNIENEKR